MTQANDLLSRIENARLWGYFHKDWLLQMRQVLRDQLPSDYRVFVESEAVLISPDEAAPVSAVLPDVSVGRTSARSAQCLSASERSTTTAVVEAEELCELETHYVLLIRRAPEQHIVAVVELSSPSNKGLGNRLDQQQHLRKRYDYLYAGVSLLEIDALLRGDRDLPDALTVLNGYQRCASTAHIDSSKRCYRGWGWNESDPLPEVDWYIDACQGVTINLGQTLDAAVGFNDWSRLPAD